LAGVTPANTKGKVAMLQWHILRAANGRPYMAIITPNVVGTQIQWQLVQQCWGHTQGCPLAGLNPANIKMQCSAATLADLGQWSLLRCIFAIMHKDSLSK
jgi:hypothetical protein